MTKVAAPWSATADGTLRGMRGRGTAVVVGAVCGLTWAAALRAYMSEIAGVATRFELYGTLVGILLPGAIIGALYGWALVSDRGVRAIRWAPALFVVAPMTMPGAIVALVTQGLGGGAVMVAATAVAGGFALGRVGPVWGRALAGAFAALGVAGIAVSTPIIVGGLGRPEARIIWVTILATGLMALFVIASAIPWRPIRRVPPAER